jgi:hypothetical protein
MYELASCSSLVVTYVDVSPPQEALPTVSLTRFTVIELQGQLYLSHDHEQQAMADDGETGFLTGETSVTGGRVLQWHLCCTLRGQVSYYQTSTSRSLAVSLHVTLVGLRWYSCAREPGGYLAC